MRLRTALIGTGGAAALTAAMFLAPQSAGAAPQSAGAAPQWAPAGEAAIHPGVQTSAAGQQCTSNFVFSSGDEVYLGQAAHCTGGGNPTATDGCATNSLPLGTPIDIEGASQPGTLVYNSWIAMQERKEEDQNACDFNDFALVRVDPADRGKVNPTVPKFGGPTGIDPDGAGRGESVFSYQNSELRLGIEPLKPKQGISLGNNGAYGVDIVTFTPGIPGDSGSGILSSNGQALGVLSTMTVFPIPATNGVSRLGPALDYMHRFGPAELRTVQLATGEAFSAPGIPILGLFF